MRQILRASYMAMILLLPAIGCREACEAREVIHEEFGPRAMLKKYSWFKDAAAQLDQKRASIEVYKVRIADVNETYADKKVSDWPRDVRQDLSQMKAEMSGLIVSYNLLAAEYNSQMAKFNWRFTNAGTLPAGAIEPLPREFREYNTGN